MPLKTGRLSTNPANTQLPGLRLTNYFDAGGTDSYCIEVAYADNEL